MIDLDEFPRDQHSSRFVSVESNKPVNSPVTNLVRSVFIMAAAVSGESTTMYKLVSSANNRIAEPMSLTISFM